MGKPCREEFDAMTAVDPENNAMSAYQREHNLTGPTQSAHTIGWDDLDKRKFYVIGPTMMMSLRLILYPPMMVKTRLQVQQGTKLYNGTFDAFRKIWMYEGWRGFYKGFWTNSLGIIAGQCYVTSLELTKHHAKALPYLDRSETGRHMLAGGVAAIVTQSIVVPVDIVSQLQMVKGQVTTQAAHEAAASNHQQESKRKNAVAIARGIYSSQGVAGFYRGYGVSMLNFVPNHSIFWATYSMMSTAVGRAAPDSPLPLIQAASGCTAGIVASTLTNPIDVTRAKLQVDGLPSVKETVKLLWKENGIAFLGKGLTARLITASLSSAIIVSGYESIKRLSVRTN